MKKTLYLLRKPLEHIHPALFLPSHSRGDVVLLEHRAGPVFPYAGGALFSLTHEAADHGLTYDGLVKKIFECDHTVVI
jgi:hypothetical protein